MNPQLGVDDRIWCKILLSEMWSQDKVVQQNEFAHSCKKKKKKKMDSIFSLPSKVALSGWFANGKWCTFAFHSERFPVQPLLHCLYPTRTRCYIALTLEVKKYL